MSRKTGTDLPLVVIAGATATGKSDLAIALAERVGGEVINADALQLYRGMDIGTAKVTPEERRGIKHHLLDVLDVREEASVARYQTEARKVVRAVREAGRVPIAVGGSGLYLRALTDRMEFPPSDPVVRAELDTLARETGPGPLLDELRRKDPEAAAKIAPGDERRIVRALEVNRITGRPFSSYLPSYTFWDPAVVYTATQRPRDALHERVQARVMRMIEQGFVDEVGSLLEAGLREGKTARQAIGYAQMIAHLDGALSLDEAIEHTVVGTRKLVRKQDTWFRRDPRLTWLNGERPGESLRTLETLIAASRG